MSGKAAECLLRAFPALEAPGLWQQTLLGFEAPLFRSSPVLRRPVAEPSQPPLSLCKDVFVPAPHGKESQLSEGEPGGS